MMDPVHSRSDDDPYQKPFHLKRQLPIAVVEFGCCLKDTLENQKQKRSHSKKRNLQAPEAYRKNHLHEMEPEGSRNIQIQIDMMHIVEPPEQRELVIHDVPIVER